MIAANFSARRALSSGLTPKDSLRSPARMIAAAVGVSTLLGFFPMMLTSGVRGEGAKARAETPERHHLKMNPGHSGNEWRGTWQLFMRYVVAA